MTAPERYPGYDVLSKRNTPSWNEQTRRAIDQRLAVPREPQFFSEAEWQTLVALCDRIMPQPPHRPPVPLAAYVDRKVRLDHQDGFRQAAMPRQQEAWRRGLAALDEAARQAHGGRRFHEITPAEQDALLRQAQRGELDGPAWGGMPSAAFFVDRVMHDILSAYYAHPTAWNEIGWGGPAGPRGYVRMGFDKRDPWEAAEARPGQADKAREENRRVG
ncbi:gluconate 2-dehydrogenase subunit 3 family protein [Rhodopila globiformis]|uniref:Gluconate 2-dehydrogenase n=1 Tax=Rhodopila globiformis TaxID=1071 RepID=A0A2S6MTN3_RHOGL|nr:gluconate 2-dehydrogenase subunit 3 family protein [Rhodopila globiformis]PPQ25725.1 gluconate 2-dehydrogenase [Rhodopila globiformis]